jgi:HK97 family phage major capsid protein
MESVANLTQMKRELAELLRDLEVGESEMRVGRVTAARGEELEAKAQEAQEIQDHIDRYNRISGVAQQGREIQEKTLPATNGSKGPKVITTTPGHLFALSQQFRSWSSHKQGWSAKVDVKDLRGGRVKLYGEEADKFEAMVHELKTTYSDALLSDVSAAITTQVDQDLVRVMEPEILTIRDVLNILPATSDSVRFVRYTPTHAAASQQRRDDYGDLMAARKPWKTMAVDSQTVSIETVAVLQKVTEQDIEDWPRMVGIVNSEMRLDVKVEEERLLLHGTGADGEIEGLWSQGVDGVYEFDDAVAGDTTIDTIRRMRASLRSRRVFPTAVLIHPTDWANIELLKGATEGHYIWGLVTDLRGPRIWSLRVIESDAMLNETTGERRILMGDFVRGATLYDRHDVRLAVGFVDDDFARNLRTLRAEERLALAVKRPWAFEYSVVETES